MVFDKRRSGLRPLDRRKEKGERRKEKGQRRR